MCDICMQILLHILRSFKGTTNLIIVRQPNKYQQSILQCNSELLAEQIANSAFQAPKLSAPAVLV